MSSSVTRYCWVFSISPSPLCPTPLGCTPTQHPDSAEMSASSAAPPLTWWRGAGGSGGRWGCCFSPFSQNVPSLHCSSFSGSLYFFVFSLLLGYFWQISDDFAGKCWHLQTSRGRQDSAFLIYKDQHYFLLQYLSFFNVCSLLELQVGHLTNKEMFCAQHHHRYLLDQG